MASFLNNLTQYLQQQSFDFQPSLFEVGNETLPLVDSLERQQLTTSADVTPHPLESPSLFDLVELQPVVPNSEATPQPLALIQPKPTSPVPISPTEDLDTVLSQMVTDDPLSLNTAPTFGVDSSQSIGDEVDQLYASLFGTEDSPHAHLEVETNELSSLETDTTTVTVIPAQPEPEADSSALVLDPLAPGILDLSNTSPGENLDASSATWETLFFLEEVQPPADVTPTDIFSQEVDSQIASVDTITGLTDLGLEELIPDSSVVEYPATTAPENQEEVVSSSSLTEDSSQPITTSSAFVNYLATNISEVPVTASSVRTENEESEHAVDNYIPASLQENLLSLEDIHPSN